MNAGMPCGVVGSQTFDHIGVCLRNDPDHAHQDAHNKQDRRDNQNSSNDNHISFPFPKGFHDQFCPLNI